jgi:putative Mg2+ transporter-C (MgtC) family protein
MDIASIALKLLLAVALGGLIGLERESSHKPAGFRTNILICAGSTMMMILSGLILGQEQATAGDFTRIAAAVIIGMGFIGAGSIIQARGAVYGLTTAATLWTVAGLGLVVGAGFYFEAVIFTAVIILTLIIFRLFEDRFMAKLIFRYSLRTSSPAQVITAVKKVALHEGIKFKEIKHKKEQKIAVIHISFASTAEIEQKFHQSLLNIEDISEITIE